jgi:hypothetical protein
MFVFPPPYRFLFSELRPDRPQLVIELSIGAGLWRVPQEPRQSEKFAASSLQRISVEVSSRSQPGSCGSNETGKATIFAK